MINSPEGTPDILIEPTPLMLDALTPAQAIAAATQSWLKAEIENSGTNNNAGLDKFDNYVTDGLGKIQGHQNRQIKWTNLFADNPDDKEVIKLQLFTIFMRLSGAFRTQCQLRSVSQNEYTYRRLHGPLSFDIGQVVNAHLINRFGELPSHESLSEKTVDSDEVANRTHNLNEMTTYQTVHALNLRGSDSKKRYLGLHLRFDRLQKQWLDLGIDYLLHGAYINNGDLRSVEMLGPTSRAKANSYHPFI